MFCHCAKPTIVEVLNYIVLVFLICRLLRGTMAQRRSLHDRASKIADHCTQKLLEPHVLQIFEPFCVHNAGQMFTRCRNQTTSTNRILEWYGINTVSVHGTQTFDSLLQNRGVTWHKGTTFGSYLGQFPHSVQGLLPLLNFPILGLNLTRFVPLPSLEGFPTDRGIYHPFANALLQALHGALGVQQKLFVAVNSSPSLSPSPNQWWLPVYQGQVCIFMGACPLNLHGLLLDHAVFDPCSHTHLPPVLVSSGVYRAQVQWCGCVRLRTTPPSAESTFFLLWRASAYRSA